MHFNPSQCSGNCPSQLHSNIYLGEEKTKIQAKQNLFKFYHTVNIQIVGSMEYFLERPSISRIINLDPI